MFCAMIQFFSTKLWIRIMKTLFHFNFLIEVSNSANYLSSFQIFFDSGTVKNWKNVKLCFSRKIFCFSALHRPVIEPLSTAWKTKMLQLNHRCLIFFFNCFNKNFAPHFNFSPNFRIKITNDSFHLSFIIQQFIWVVFLFFGQLNSNKLQKVKTVLS